LDHISASWGEDETISTWYAPHDLTISWSIISEGLHKSRHPKGAHSAGLIIGDGSNHVSVHHSLFAHNFMRNPLYTGGGTHDLVNNVIYNWGWLATDINDDKSNTKLNVVGNYYRRGANSTRNYAITINPDYGGGVPLIYVKGNLGPRRLDARTDEWALVSNGYENASMAPSKYRVMSPFAAPPVTTLSATDALEAVLSRAGATAPKRDSVDSRVVASVRNRSGSIINSPDEAGGYPDYVEGNPPRDSDDDGMPDDWENKIGLDPRNPADANSDHDGDGYTNIEEYLHSLM
jgi:pectate lyase